jgi:hypothetical protein
MRYTPCSQNRLEHPYSPLDTWSVGNVENGNNRLAARLIVGHDAVQV